MNIPHQWLIILIIIPSTFLQYSTAKSIKNDRKNNVLILNAYHQGYHWTNHLMDGVFSEFKDRDDVNLFVEYMDTKRHTEQPYYQQLKELYSYKYKNIPIDIIITCDDNALNFIFKYGEELFPNTPVSFCGIVDFNYSQPDDKLNHVTGVLEAFDETANIELILNNHPDTQEIVIIGDNSTTASLLINRLRKTTPAYQNELNFRYLIHSAKKDLIAELKNLKPTSAILWTILLKFPDGEILSSKDSLTFIQKHCSNPIYSLWDVVGQGIIGSKVSNPYYQGAEASRIALKILNGTLPTDIPIEQNPMVYMFDYDEVKKHNIKISDLPEQKIWVNHPHAFFEKHKTTLLTLIVIIITLLIMVVVLISLYKRSREAEKKLRTTNKELHHAREKAIEGDRLKTAFLTNLSHEIRTPMNGIIGTINAIKDDDLTEDEKKQFLEIIEESGERMLILIEDLINISKIESGIETVHESQFSLNEVMQSLHQFYNKEASKRHIELHHKNGLPDSESHIISDKIKLQQILDNLIKNALKYTPKGHIQFSYILNQKTLQFKVEDTGPGIPPKARDYIFERFRKIDDSPYIKNEGLGLGLPISKAFIELMRGRIWIEPHRKKGSCFIFEIEYKKAKY